MVILRLGTGLEKSQHGTNAHDLLILRRIPRAHLGLPENSDWFGG